jgi:23S rRNA pseudouridine1911/1915/1917 synthase
MNQFRAEDYSVTEPGTGALPAVRGAGAPKSRVEPANREPAHGPNMATNQSPQGPVDIVALDDDADPELDVSGAAYGPDGCPVPKVRKGAPGTEAVHAALPASAVIPDGTLRRVAPPAFAGERLDKTLARVFPEYSRGRLQSWIEAGRVRVDGAVGTTRQPVPLAAVLVVHPDLSPEQMAFIPEAIPLAVVHEDAALLVVDKPAGLVVHPAAGNWGGTLLNGLLHRYGAAAAGLPRAGIVHRLDKDTSGLMVVARTLIAQTELVRQLQARTVKRRYLAFVWGSPPATGTIDAPLGRDPRTRVRMAVVPGAAGKPARTHFRTLASAVWAGQSVSAVQCDLDTGRTHQIRVHLAHIGFPLLGDPLYGRARRAQVTAVALPDGFSRQALHAWQLGLLHPDDGVSQAWHAPLPPDMASLADHLGFGEVVRDWLNDARLTPVERA